MLVPLLMLAIVGTLAYEYQVVLPLLAKFTFGGNAGTYATMSALMGTGAVAGGLATAAGGRRPATSLAWTAIVFGTIQTLTSMAPTLLITYATMVLLGAASIRFLALGNATLQLASEPAMRGRVMALWAVAFLGSTPIGGPIVGWVGEHIGARFALGVGGVATLASGVLAYRALARIEARPQTMATGRPYLHRNRPDESLGRRSLGQGQPFSPRQVDPDETRIGKGPVSVDPRRHELAETGLHRRPRQLVDYPP